MRRPALLLAIVVALALPGAAAAHPLGNFTINHYTGVRLAPDRVELDHVIDMAEIPAFQVRQRLDADGDGEPDDRALATYPGTACAEQARSLELRHAGSPLQLIPAGSALAFPPGQNGLPTLRLVCAFWAPFGAPLTAATSIDFADTSFAERIGWREIVVSGDRVTPDSARLARSSTSARLTAYPGDLLAVPLDVRSVRFTAAPGGPALPPFRAPELAALVAQASPATPAAVPGGVGSLAPELAAVVGSGLLTPPMAALALLVAAALGAGHALTPGHGKTIMAAYLVGTRGRVRQAIGLGLTVALSHTLGVLLLGLVTVSAASVLPPERINPLLGFISAVLVLGIGLWLLLGVLRRVRHGHAAGHLHAGGHAHDRDGWHEHGGNRHRHLPTDAAPSWRGVFALGLAGGLVPSTAALFLLLGSASMGRAGFGLVLVVAFGLGMAAVMSTIGIGLVYARRLLERLPAALHSPRWSLLASGAAALTVVGAGLWLTGQALTGPGF